jgi:hypothetical protein
MNNPTATLEERLHAAGGNSPLLAFRLEALGGSYDSSLTLKQRVTEAEEWTELAGPEPLGLSSAEKQGRQKRQSSLMDRCRSLIGNLLSELQRATAENAPAKNLTAEIESTNAEIRRMKALPGMQELLPMREELQRTKGGFEALTGLAMMKGINVDSAIAAGLAKIASEKKAAASKK